jgi:hypothetical protein
MILDLNDTGGGSRMQAPAVVRRSETGEDHYGGPAAPPIRDVDARPGPEVVVPLWVVQQRIVACHEGACDNRQRGTEVASAAAGGTAGLAPGAQYQWHVTHQGGGHHSPESYTWKYRPVNDPNWQVVGTGTSYSRFVTLADWDFWLMITASIGSVVALDGNYVTVSAGPCDPNDPFCPD